MAFDEKTPSPFEAELKVAVIVADASTKAFARSILIGTIPIIEFGLLIILAMALARVPLKLLKGVE
jgi:hypothetical protein